ncbi:ferredoxin, 2Fe-2S [Magnetococcus marinus MC-1]|uniref:Ferredoxin, 2Fe-2S n=1 Tax=Magnetococcus marinus (strain ATCC BAA-1437 / JCM 17883 / MC-1) TaxID=156889 RepID=A0L3N3_MAGMM|nr:(2Fe-2S) ferredoxin domain-containing protein [Magnetococcus marinus]ABK42576.1 ferredoxin, 2Fe-2S [Magnetococcus marinus MC-1]
MKPKHHVFVCMNRRPEGHPRGSCQASGSQGTFEAFNTELEKRGMYEQVFVTGTFCMGPCDRGPVAVVYPEGVWYGNVKPEDVSEIFDKHFVDGGEPVERLRIM